MATFSKQLLSGSTNGKGILVSGTASGSADTIHTAIAGASSIDEVWLYCTNTDAAQKKLTIEFGGTATDNLIEVGIAAESGLVLVIPGLILQNSLLVKAFAETTNVLSISGYVNRIVP